MCLTKQVLLSAYIFYSEISVFLYLALFKNSAIFYYI